MADKLEPYERLGFYPRVTLKVVTDDVVVFAAGVDLRLDDTCRQYMRRQFDDASIAAYGDDMVWVDLPLNVGVNWDEWSGARRWRFTHGGM